MNIKIYRSYLFKLSLALLVTLGLGACGEDFLELSPSEALPLGSAIRTVDDLGTAVNGMYDQFQNSDYYGRYFILVPDVMSDDVKQNASANRAKEYAEYAAFPSHFITQEMWEEIYEAINRANTVINAQIDVPAAVQDDYDQLVGEALAARALAHFDLVRLYGQHFGFTPDNSHPGVPIVLEFDQEGEPARNTVGEVYNQIVQDFEAAIDLLNDNRGTGSISKAAAQGLLARVMLYMGNWSRAESLATEVIENSGVTLTPTEGYVDAWMSGTSPDVLFEIVMTEVDNNGSDALGRMYITEGYGDYLPSQDVVSLIPDGDVRGELFKDDAANLGGIYGDIRVNKWPSIQGADNTPVIRLSEVYLIRAEARYHLDDEEGAQADVTAIRQRGLPSAPAVTATGEDLFKEIMQEKRIELMFEGHRLWDLMRWNLDVVRTDCTAPAEVCRVTYPDDRFILPIPQDEINANPNVTQNEGY